MTEHLIVGINGVLDSPAALEWAAQRSVHRDAVLELVHVVDDAWGTSAPEVIADAVTAAERRLHDYADEVRESHEGIRVRSRAIVGSPVYSLADLAEHADALVIGSRPRDSRAGLGLKPSRIARAAHGSVIIVPPGSSGTDVVVGVDGSDASGRAIRFAAAEADRFGERLIAVHSWQPPWFWGLTTEYAAAGPPSSEELILAEALAGIATDYPDVVVVRSLPERSAVDALADAAAGARMLVVGSHGRSALGKRFLGSVSEELAVRLPAALAIVR